MALGPKRVLGIDVDGATVRGMVLANETSIVAGGYAQLDYESAAGPVSYAARIASALDVKATLPVAVTCDSSVAHMADEIATAIAQAGFARVSVVDRAEARRRANPTGGIPNELAGVQIPSGLLTSHAGLTLADLEAVVGAALGLLSGPAPAGASPSASSTEPNANPDWTTASPAPEAPDTDPFTSIPEPDSQARASAAAAAAALAAAVAAARGDDDDDLTVPAPADRLTMPGPNTPGDHGDGDDLTVAAGGVHAEGLAVGDDPTTDAGGVYAKGEDLAAGGVGGLAVGDDPTTDAEFGDGDDLTVAAGGVHAEGLAVGDDPTTDAGFGEGDDLTTDAGGVYAEGQELTDADNPVDDDITGPSPAVDAAAAATAGAALSDPFGVVDDDATVDPAQASAVDQASPVAPVAFSATTTSPASSAPDAPASTIAEEAKSSGRSTRTVLLVVAAIALLAVIGLAITQCGGDDDTDDVATEQQAAGADDDAGDVATEQQAAGADDDAGDVATEQQAAGADDDAGDVATEQQAAGADDDASGDDIATPETDPTAGAEEPTPAATSAATPVPAPAPSATPEPAATATPEPTPEPTADPIADLPPLSSLPERGAIFRPPTLFLEGPVQTQEQADELYAAAIAVVGPDNVVNNYVVRPDAPPALDGNVRVEQAVLFETGSAVIAEDFFPTLELGVAVMALNPQVQMVVEGHTDSVGSDASNLALSQRRAEAVVEYLVGRGVDQARLQAVGLGETTPVADNDTAEGRQINRRIEVELLDLLAG